MLTLNTARRLALEGIARVTGRCRDDVRLLDEETRCSRTGWSFRWESRAYVETRDVAYAIGDTGPVIVTHRGVTHVLAGGPRAPDAVADFERFRAACTTHR
jgi:hypothetical protein